jgi:hypothetical protein
VNCAQLRLALFTVWPRIAVPADKDKARDRLGTNDGQNVEEWPGAGASFTVDFVVVANAEGKHVWVAKLDPKTIGALGDPETVAQVQRAINNTRRSNVGYVKTMRTRHCSQCGTEGHYDRTCFHWHAKKLGLIVEKREWPQSKRAVVGARL